jgi:hypothetical protein
MSHHFCDDDSLIIPQIRYALGNVRPHTLWEVEKAACRAIMRIVSGSSAEKELQAFLAEYDEMTQLWREQGITDWALDFYDNGTLLSSLIVNLKSTYEYSQGWLRPISPKPSRSP